ncbi:serine/threonine-protein kinase [Tsukamurella pseudospumae]|uniref:non-specific serine/threonine protein kinase n=1 Tax=Tsukamurella pseudospumae TaxID=239498 RepID=A0A138AUX4_9ACTN|nr:serine/threonine-protein kinase [Tsukamurella pseudospumae]KXP00538.1 hypothetical protein AXK61_15215 [Tsukamurella pseudospumae]KXP14224.1 hypothetical protein AXK60_21310 [Tsukamurella pseudospumae]
MGAVVGLSDYTVIRPLGRGAMGEVFLVRHPRLPRMEALKLLMPALARDEVYRARFHREAAMLATVSHPNIVTVFDSGTASDRLWMTSEFIDGPDVLSLIRRNGALDPCQVIDIVRPIAEALEFVWSRYGLVHRDIKPANILTLLDGDRPAVVKLADFGVATMTELTSGLTETRGMVGTLAYLAPEVIHGDGADPRSDQYSMACSAFEMLTGSLPYRVAAPAALMIDHLHTPPPSASARRPGLSEAVDAVLAKGMAKSPNMRYRSTADFASALASALSGGGVPHRHTEWTSRRYGLRWRAVAAMCVVALLLTTAVVLVGPLGWGSQRVAGQATVGEPALDTGNFGTAPRTVVARTESDAWQQESLNMTDAVVAPWEVDSDFQYRFDTTTDGQNYQEVSGPVVSTAKFGYQTTARLFNQEQASALRAIKMTAGYVAVSVDAMGDAANRVLRVGMLRFRTAEAADLALRAVGAKPSTDASLKGAGNTVTILDELLSVDSPDGSGKKVPVRTLTAAIKVGDLLVVAGASGADSGGAAKIVAKALTMQEKRSAEYRPTPVPTSSPEIPRVPMDRDGVMSATLPNKVDTNSDQGFSPGISAGDGYVSARGWALNQGSYLTKQTLDEYGVDLVGSTQNGNSVIFRAKDATQAGRMFAGFVSDRTAGGVRNFGVPGLNRVTASCTETPEARSDGSVRQYYVCRVHRGRYMAGLGSFQKTDALQGIAAQYKLLGSLP